MLAKLIQSVYTTTYIRRHVENHGSINPLQKSRRPTFLTLCSSSCIPTHTQLVWVYGMVCCFRVSKSVIRTFIWSSKSGCPWTRLSLHLTDIPPFSCQILTGCRRWQIQYWYAAGKTRHGCLFQFSAGNWFYRKYVHDNYMRWMSKSASPSSGL